MRLQHDDEPWRWAELRDGGPGGPLLARGSQVAILYLARLYAGADGRNVWVRVADEPRAAR